jgi:hypothetical protein
MGPEMILFLGPSFSYEMYPHLFKRGVYGLVCFSFGLFLFQI